MARDVQAGGAFIKLYLTGRGQVEQGIRGVGSQIKSIAGLAGRLTATLGAIGLGAGFIASIRAASDMQETMSKFNVVFGESSEVMKAWSDDTAKAVGRSKKQIASFLASSQDLLVPLGFESGDAQEISKQIAQLAIDLASFNNVADEDAFRDIQAALTGSGEVMKKYGVVVNEARVKQELLNESIDPKIATEAQKAYARLKIILQGTVAAQGDALRTSDSFANSWKRLQATIADSSVELGERFLPAVTLLVRVVSDAILVLADMGREGTNSFDGMSLSAESLVGTLGEVVDAFNKTFASLKFIVAGYQSLKSVLYSIEALKLRLIPGEFAKNLREEFEAIAQEANLAAQKWLSMAEQGWNSNAAEDFKKRMLDLQQQPLFKPLQQGVWPAAPPVAKAPAPTTEGLDRLRAIEHNTARALEQLPEAALEKSSEAARAIEQNKQNALLIKEVEETKRTNDLLKEISAFLVMAPGIAVIRSGGF